MNEHQQPNDQQLLDQLRRQRDRALALQRTIQLQGSLRAAAGLRRLPLVVAIRWALRSRAA